MAHSSFTFSKHLAPSSAQTRTSVSSYQLTSVYQKVLKSNIVKTGKSNVPISEGRASPFSSAWAGRRDPTCRAWVTGPQIHFSQRNTWVVYGPCQDGSQQFTLGRPRILQDSTSRATHLSRKPRGDFKNQKKTKQKPAYRKMTTVHGCVSNKHHHQRK